MVKRKRIALAYEYNEEWIAGVYYIENLVCAMCTLPDELKPVLVILCENQRDYANLEKRTAYPYLKWINPAVSVPLWRRLCNRIYRNIFGHNIFENRLKGKLFDMVYPVGGSYYLQLLDNKVEWIPDFQEDYYPEFFSPDLVIRRKNGQRYLAYNNKRVVVSSYDALNDFLRLFPDHNASIHVVQFAVSLPPIDFNKTGVILEKYQLRDEFFMCSNQFWRHKNHMVILQALKHLRQQGETKVVVAFSGKPNDFRYPGYYDELKDFVEQSEIRSQAIFLDFIPREDQLILMKSAKAVIQPSLFEGWGTTIEDAKALGQFVIASDIPVHHEQLSSNFCLFPPHDHTALASLLISNIKKSESQDYESNLSRAAYSFIKVLEG